MPRRHQHSGSRNAWTDERLQAALKAVIEGKLKPHAAALKCGSTLYSHLKCRSQKRYGGRPTALMCAEEEEIATAC